MSSWRVVEILKNSKIRFAAPSKIQITGLKINVSAIIGRTSRTAKTSALDIAKRLGIKSASRENKLVITTKEITDDTASFLTNSCKYGLIADSPTAPAEMATAFSTTCTTVINPPGFSCICKTSRARTSPSFAMICSLILRPAAIAISAPETKALKASNNKRKILAVSKLMTDSDNDR